MVKFPDFVRFGSRKGVCLRLTSISGHEATYYRDGGAWSTKAKFVNGQLVSCGHPNNKDWRDMNNKPLYETTRVKWKEDNEYYAPTNFNMPSQ